MTGFPGNPDFKPGNNVGISGRWQKGQSGNPRGRPLSKPYKEALEQQLQALAQLKGIPPDQAYGMVAAAHVAKAMSGDMAAIKELADRIDGKVPNPIGGTEELLPITAFSWKPIDAVEHIVNNSNASSDGDLGSSPGDNSSVKGND